MVEIWDIQHKTAGITVRCDGLSALDRSFYVSSPIKLSQDHIDSLSGTQGIIKATHINWILVHIKGPQNKPRDKLTRW